ncbi:MAG: hypothetical protein H6722_01665 [Sandaracinus sp.]|nr:hypothetical protein [Sandaracinus sp.]
MSSGETATFLLNGVIAGWTEGVQLMVEGEKRRFNPGVACVPGSSAGRSAGMLVFDVERLSASCRTTRRTTPREEEA